MSNPDSNASAKIRWVPRARIAAFVHSKVRNPHGKSYIARRFLQWFSGLLILENRWGAGCVDTG
jgi:hypothetical protein